MPLYEYECEDGHITEAWRSIAERNEPIQCECGKESRKIMSAAGFHMDHEDHYNENNGRGRYYSQLGDKPNDPKAYCRTREECREKAKRRGYQVTNLAN